MPLFRRSSSGPHTLAVVMTGIAMGERLLQVGRGRPARFAALAAKIGLTGTAAAVVETEADAAVVRVAAASAGVLVEVHVAPFVHMPFGEASFDLVVIDRTSARSAPGPADPASGFQEVRRILRPAGRAIVIDSAGSGLTQWFGRRSGDPQAIVRALEAAGFRPVRTLARREGLAFVEGIKPKQG